jgi:hypothetical protein
MNSKVQVRFLGDLGGVTRLSYPTMLRIVLILSLFSTLSSSALPTDDYATITFDQLEIHEKGWQGRTFYFKVNGTTFSPDENIHKIRINTKSFDTIVLDPCKAGGEPNRKNGKCTSTY